jgi:hypothetical protein
METDVISRGWGLKDALKLISYCRTERNKDVFRKSAAYVLEHLPKGFEDLRPSLEMTGPADVANQYTAPGFGVFVA